MAIVVRLDVMLALRKVRSKDLADAIGITGFLHVQEKLGEMLSQMEVARAVFYGSEAMAQRLPNGVWVPGGPGLRASSAGTRARTGASN